MRFTAVTLVVLIACNGDERSPQASQTLAQTAQSALTVCADPNNLPFSNSREEGFENQIARLVAAELGMPLRYTWWAQRRGFIRNTLREGTCDLIVGIAASHELVLATRPYYRSTYAFVTRADRGLAITSLDDPRLRSLTVGVHFIGDDGANAPPAHGLTRRGIVRNVRGYSIFGDYARRRRCRRRTAGTGHRPAVRRE